MFLSLKNIKIGVEVMEEKEKEEEFREIKMIKDEKMSWEEIEKKRKEN